MLAARALFVLSSVADESRARAVAALCAFSPRRRPGRSNCSGERSSAFDLALTGRLTGVAPDETRATSRWSDLRALPTSAHASTGNSCRDRRSLTVVFLDDS